MPPATIRPVQPVGATRAGVAVAAHVVPPVNTVALPAAMAAEGDGMVVPPKRAKGKGKGKGKGKQMMPMMQQWGSWPESDGEWGAFNQQAGEYMNKMVQDFAHAATDLSTSDEQLDGLYQQLLSCRNPMGFFWAMQGSDSGGKAMPALMGAPAGEVHLSDAEMAERRESLLRAVSEHLQSKGGEEALSICVGDPQVAALRKGAVSNVTKFLREFPQYFDFKWAPNPVEGKNQIQMLVLVKPVPAGGLGGLKRKREEPKADLHEALIQALAEALGDAGGSATISDLGVDLRVQAAAVGVKDKLGKFMQGYPDVFALENDQAGSARASLRVPPATAVSTADVRAKLGAA